MNSPYFRPISDPPFLGPVPLRDKELGRGVIVQKRGDRDDDRVPGRPGVKRHPGEKPRLEALVSILHNGLDLEGTGLLLEAGIDRLHLAAKFAPGKGIDHKGDILAYPEASHILLGNSEGKFEKIGTDDRDEKGAVADIVPRGDLLFLYAAGHGGMDLRLGQFLLRQIESGHCPFHIPLGNGKTRNDIIKLLLRDQFLPVEGLLSLMLLFRVGQGRLRLLQNGRRLLKGKLVIGLLDIGDDLTGGYGRSFVDVDRLEDPVQFGTDIDNFVGIEGPDRLHERPERSILRRPDPDVDGLLLLHLLFLLLASARREDQDTEEEGQDQGTAITRQPPQSPPAG